MVIVVHKNFSLQIKYDVILRNIFDYIATTASDPLVNIFINKS